MSTDPGPVFTKDLWRKTSPPDKFQICFNFIKSNRKKINVSPSKFTFILSISVDNTDKGDKLFTELTKNRIWNFLLIMKG